MLKKQRLQAESMVPSLLTQCGETAGWSPSRIVWESWRGAMLRDRSSAPSDERGPCVEVGKTPRFADVGYFGAFQISFAVGSSDGGDATWADGIDGAVAVAPMGILHGKPQFLIEIYPA